MIFPDSGLEKQRNNSAGRAEEQQEGAGGSATILIIGKFRAAIAPGARSQTIWIPVLFLQGPALAPRRAKPGAFSHSAVAEEATADCPTVRGGVADKPSPWLWSRTHVTENRRQAMSDDNVTRLPIRGDQRWKNRLGKRAVPCIVTMRWLQFPETSAALQDGHFMFVDVMTAPEGQYGPACKLCQLCISKEDLLAALGEVD